MNIENGSNVQLPDGQPARVYSVDGDTASLELLNKNGQYKDQKNGEHVKALLVDLKPWQVVPTVGMGATISSYSDSTPATIIKVEGKTIVIQEDNAKRTDDNGMSESQTYDYSANLKGATSIYTLRKNGRWIQKGARQKGGPRISLGTRSKYHDYSF